MNFIGAFYELHKFPKQSPNWPCYLFQKFDSTRHDFFISFLHDNNAEKISMPLSVSREYLETVLPLFFFFYSPDVITPALFPRKNHRELYSLLIRIGFVVQSPDSRCLFSVRGEEKRRVQRSPKFSGRGDTDSERSPFEDSLEL